MKNEKVLINRVKKYVKSQFKNEKTGHDINHLLRVFKNAKYLQKKEGGNKTIILISALVHDFHRLLGTKQYVTPEKSLPIIKKLLQECEIEEDAITQILEVVKQHENKSNSNVNQETKIVMDADTLDAVGRIGLKRTLKYCKQKNIPITNTCYLLNCSEYIPDINPISTCHYIYRTMMANACQMKTKTGQKLSKNKIKVLDKFLLKKLGDTYKHLVK